MTDRRMLLVAHTGRTDIAITAGAAANRLHDAGIELVSLAGESGELDLAVFDPWDTDNGPIEMVLAIGGDGTLLRAAEHARPLSAPVLGINLGRVGFLTEVDLDQMDEALEAVVDQRYRVSSRMTVEVTVEHDGARGGRRLGAERDQCRKRHQGKNSRRRRRGGRARRLRLRV